MVDVTIRWPFFEPDFGGASGGSASVMMTTLSAPPAPGLDAAAGDGLHWRRKEADARAEYRLYGHRRAKGRARQPEMQGGGRASDGETVRHGGADWAGAHRDVGRR